MVFMCIKESYKKNKNLKNSILCFVDKNIYNLLYLHTY